MNIYGVFLIASLSPSPLAGVSDATRVDWESPSSASSALDCPSVTGSLSSSSFTSSLVAPGVELEDSSLWSIFLPFHPPVLEPYFDLALGQAEHLCYLHAPTTGQVPVEVEFFLHLQCLVPGVGLTSTLSVWIYKRKGFQSARSKNKNTTTLKPCSTQAWHM